MCYSHIMIYSRFGFPKIKRLEEKMICCCFGCYETKNDDILWTLNASFRLQCPFPFKAKSPHNTKSLSYTLISEKATKKKNLM